MKKNYLQNLFIAIICSFGKHFLVLYVIEKESVLKRSIIFKWFLHKTFWNSCTKKIL